MWRGNTKASVTRQFFVEWIYVFVSTVKEYLQDKKLPLKCLLVLDNAPTHSPGFENDLVDEFHFIYVKYLPLNSTSPIQPIDQQIIANAKKLYTKALFRKCFQINMALSLLSENCGKIFLLFETVLMLLIIMHGAKLVKEI